jgi:hypothetical protein
MKTIKCKHCDKCFFCESSDDRCPHCGKCDDSVVDVLKEMFGGEE